MGRIRRGGNVTRPFPKPDLGVVRPNPEGREMSRFVSVVDAEEYSRRLEAALEADSNDAWFEQMERELEEREEAEIFRDIETESRLKQEVMRRTTIRPNECGKMRIGMLGSGNSKGDGPGPYIDKVQWDQMTASERAACKKARKEEKAKKGQVWKTKSRSPRGGKNAELIGASVSKMAEEASGEIDAAVELALSSLPEPSAPPMPPPSDPITSRKEKNPGPIPDMSTDVQDDVRSRFDFDIREKSYRGRTLLFFLCIFFVTYFTDDLIKVGLLWTVNPGTNIIAKLWFRYALTSARALVVTGLSWLLFQLFPSSWLTTRRVVEKYRFVSFVDHTANDERADAIALGELKHSKPQLARVECYTINDDWFSRYIWLRWHKTKLIVSLELIAQATTAGTSSLSCTDEVVFQKIVHAIRSMHSVNYSRYAGLLGIDIPQNSIVVAYALHRKMLERLEHMNFPRPQQSAT